MGGGISAAQAACSLAGQGVRVTLVTRHEARVHLFDSDPIWLGPKGMTPFLREPSYQRRRATIDDARRRGSLPPEVFRRLDALAQGGRLTLVEDDIVSATIDGDASVVLSLRRGQRAITADRVVLATGFLPHRPGGALVDDAIDRFGLACGDCGYPLVSRSLEWTPGLFVTGPLAELELGPTARNISGARAAGIRLRAVAA